jgi:hypothetical protein
MHITGYAEESRYYHELPTTSRPGCLGITHFQQWHVDIALEVSVQIAYYREDMRIPNGEKHTLYRKCLQIKMH